MANIIQEVWTIQDKLKNFEQECKQTTHERDALKHEVDDEYESCVRERTVIVWTP